MILTNPVDIHCAVGTPFLQYVPTVSSWAPQKYTAATSLGELGSTNKHRRGVNLLRRGGGSANLAKAANLELFALSEKSCETLLSYLVLISHLLVMMPRPNTDYWPPSITPTNTAYMELRLV